MNCRRIEYNSSEDWPGIESWLGKRYAPNPKVEGAVKDIIADVQQRGDQALIDFTRQFDCPDFHLSSLKVPQSSLQEALASISEEEREIISEAADRITLFHEKQKRNSWMTTEEDGTVLGQMVRPVDRAGLYVPAGQGASTPLVSSLLMNAIPALVAGVNEVVVVSPPGADGKVNRHIMAAAAILGINSVFACGSAWAVAALACGTDTLPRVDVIAGPGNIFVTTAKRLLVGRVGIDMIAGPSEIAILADTSAKPDLLAADLLSQAEHDPLASALLISDSLDVLENTQVELERQLDILPRNKIARQSLQDWGGLIHVRDIETGMDLVNLLAPEHFELAVQQPWNWVGKVRNAGAVFLGETTPEPVGDYFAGPNHVLPTLGNARFSSALSVGTFCKEISLLSTSSGFVRKHGTKIAALARLEGLEAHARSVETRLK